ncbi:hypothetical protein CMI41_04450 [Candidatus Pacearchaeota archaeon]|nr:hypothetical protein [Candidatus Pacearchaeota archaeon]|tara:strand:- start:57 stop:1004 length:948 start_codon:yes stop_codon:yes gene_type:complete
MKEKSAYDRIMETIPTDTGGLIRVGMLDLTRGYGARDIINVLGGLPKLGTDARDLRNTANYWDEASPLELESGTLFRQLWFYFTKNRINRKLIPTGTLIERVERMPLDHDQVNWPLAKLGTLEGGTSQWQTAAILLGNKESLSEVPFYLRKTYTILAEWEEKRAHGESWEVPRDPTLIAQSKAYLTYLRTGQMSLQPEKLGDCDLYCFLDSFDAVSREWGEANWPQLREHESNRFETTEEMLKQLGEGKKITSLDHRVVQAAAMRIQSNILHAGKEPLTVEQLRQKFSNPDCVAKKWPRFWEAMSYFPEAAKETV